MDTGVVLELQWLTFRAAPSAIGYPALEFVGSLDPRTRGQWRSIAALMDVAEERRTHVNRRVTVIRGKKLAMLYIRITPQGGRSPCARIFGLRRGKTIWLAPGFIKKGQELDPSEITAAEAFFLDWMARGEPTDVEAGANDDTGSNEPG